MTNGKNAKIVLTGGPCAGKSTLVQLAERAFAGSVMSVPESASILFTGGFPRFAALEARRAVQRSIYKVQKEMEKAYGAQYPDLVLVLDRGTVDGAAYWPEGPDSYFQELGTTLDRELACYDRVIYLESAGPEDYERHKNVNPHRKETWEEASKLDEETKRLWLRHPNFVLVKNSRSFERKVLEVLSIIAGSMRYTDAGEKV